MRRLLAAVLMVAPGVSAQGVPAALEDLRLATAVRLALAADPETAAADPRVTARSGSVAVDADWPTPAVEARAAALAGAVRGVVTIAMGDSPPAPATHLGAGSAAEPDETPPAADEARAYEEAASDRPVEPTAAAPPQFAPPPPPRPAPAAPPADARPSPEGPATHTVRVGDTLFSIARRYGTTVAELQRLNGLGSSTRITLGGRLRVR